jgi:cell division transport system permease protein
MIRFWITETFISIRKAKASFFLSLISTCLAVLLLILSIFVFYSAGRLDRSIKEKMSLNLFLKESTGTVEQKNIESILATKTYVKVFVYRNKDEAAEKFIKETGEDFRKILDYNPLPASFEIFFKETYVRKDSIEKIKKELSSLEGVDEIYFSAEIFYRILESLNNIKIYILGITILLCVISFYLVYSTNKLILYSRIDEMNTMKLIGSTLLSIKMPVILCSVLIGIISALFSVLILYLVKNYLYFIEEGTLRYLYLPALLGGPVLGVVTSIFSMRKVNIKI